MFSNFIRGIVLALALASAAVAGTPTSTMLLGTVGQGRDDSTLVEVDPATGALVRTIGSVGYTVNGLTYDATSGVLYATTSHHDLNFPDGLITIDMTTAAGTPVGTGAGRWVNLPTANSAGEIYGWSEGPVVQSRLVKWDKAAGTVTEIGYSGISTARHTLAFDANDVLYLLTPVIYADADPVLFTLDVATAAPTEIGPVAGLRIYFAHHGAFNPDDNLLYALDATEDYSTTTNLVVIDPATHSIVSTVPTVNELHALAFVVPFLAPAPALVGVASRKVHGAAGAFDLPLPATPGDPATEPRTGDTGGEFTLVFTFDKAVTGGNAAVTEGTAVAGAPSFVGSEMIVPLTGAADVQYVTVAVNHVTSADGGIGGAGAARVGLLAGDVDGSRSVTLSDLLKVNAVLAQVVTGANYLHDVDTSGALAISDLLQVNNHLAHALPAP